MELIEENNESERKSHDHEHDGFDDSNSLKIILPVSLFVGTVCCVIIGLYCSYKLSDHSDEYTNFNEHP